MTQAITAGFSKEDLATLKGLRALCIAQGVQLGDGVSAVLEGTTPQMVANIHKEQVAEKEREQQVERGLPGRESNQAMTKEQEQEATVTLGKMAEEKAVAVQKQIQVDTSLTKDEKEIAGEAKSALMTFAKQTQEQELQQNQRIDREREIVEETERHKEKVSGKGLWGVVKDQYKEAADALAAILLPPAWNEWAEKRDQEKALAEGLKPKESKGKEEDKAQEPVTEIEKIDAKVQEEAKNIASNLRNSLSNGSVEGTAAISPSISRSKEMESKRNEEFAKSATRSLGNS